MVISTQDTDDDSSERLLAVTHSEIEEGAGNSAGQAAAL